MGPGGWKRAVGVPNECWWVVMGAGRSEMGGAGLRRAAGGQHLVTTPGLGQKRVLLGLVSQRMGQNKKRRT